MGDSIRNQMYKNFLELKINERKNKIFSSLEKDFILYLQDTKVIKENILTSDEKDLTVFFSKVVKNCFFANIYKTLNKSFLKKLEDFQSVSKNNLKNLTFKKVVVVSDKKVNKYDKDVSAFASFINKDLKADLVFRTIPERDKKWLVNNFISEVNLDIVEKSIKNIINNFPKEKLKEHYLPLHDVSNSNFKLYWSRFIEKKVWYSYERYIKAYEMLEEFEILKKMKDIYNVIEDDTLLVINNNSEDESLFFDFLFNFENELFSFITNKNNLSIVTVSERNSYKNTFLGLLSIGNVETIKDIISVNDESDYIEDTIDLSEFSLVEGKYSRIVDLFTSKKVSIGKKINIGANNNETKNNNKIENKNPAINDFTVNTLDFSTKSGETLNEFWDNLDSEYISNNDFTVRNMDFTVSDEDLVDPNNVEFKISNVINNELKAAIAKTKKQKQEEFIFNIDNVVNSSKNILSNEQVNYLEDFENFIDEFNKVRDRYNGFDFNDIKDENYNQFDNNLRKLDIKATHRIVKNYSDQIIMIVKNKDATRLELLKCYATFTHVLNMLEMIENLTK